MASETVCRAHLPDRIEGGEADHGGPPTKRRRLDRSESASSFDASSDDEVVVEDTQATPPTPLTPATPRDQYPSRQKIHLCPYPSCTKAFNRPARLEEHIRAHTNSRPFVCPHSPCDKAFLRQSHLAHHVKSAHSSVRDYRCDREGCGKRFVTATRLRRHLQAHDGRDKFRCTEFPPCKQTFRKHVTLQRHIDIDHHKVKPFRCDQTDGDTGQPCQHGYDTAAKLRAHKSKAHDVKRYWCSNCASDGIQKNLEGEDAAGLPAFSSYTELQIHIAEAHPAHCGQCSQICASTEELERHLETRHSGLAVDSPRDFQCLVPTCGKSFTKQSNLNTHVRTVHGNERPFVCGTSAIGDAKDLGAWDGHDACGQAFAHRFALENHVRRIHLGGGQPRATRPESKRKAKKAARSDSLRTSTLSRLTGADVATRGFDMMSCFHPACAFECGALIDLQDHAKEIHGMAEDDVFAAIMEREALSGGRFWLGDGDDVELLDRGFWTRDEPASAGELGVAHSPSASDGFHQDLLDMQQLIYDTPDTPASTTGDAVMFDMPDDTTGDAAIDPSLVCSF